MGSVVTSVAKVNELLITEVSMVNQRVMMHHNTLNEHLEMKLIGSRTSFLSIGLFD